MLDAAMFLEIEHGAPEVFAELQVERRRNQLVLLGQRERGDLPGRRNDRRAAYHRMPVLSAAFRRRQYPSSVLIGAGLQRQQMVKHPEMLGLAMMDVLDGRVVAERDDLDPLQSHDAVRFGPAPVVADAHTHDRVLHAPDAETFVPDIEIALLQMLERRLREMLGMAGEVDLAVAADDMPGGIDEDRGVVVPRRALLLRQLGITEIEADAELLREIEQRPRLRAGHLTLEIAVDLGL